MTGGTDLTLYLDTTTSCLMMGLGQEGELLVERSVPCDSHRYHSALIVPAIQEMLKDAGFSVRDLSALGVNHGPGSFTGIRTGIITVRTMGQFLNLPVHVFNAFELIAFNRQQSVQIWIDALRGRIYQATLNFDASGPIYDLEPSLGMVEEALSKRVLGSSLQVSSTLTSYLPNSAVELIPVNLFTPSIMVQLHAKYGSRFTCSWRDVRPLYLQEPSITLKKVKQA